MKKFETFREIDDFAIINLTHKKPSCFNGIVRVIKYRITIEKIDEPIEIIKDRIQDLWDNCDNMHHRTPLTKTAKKYGLKL